MRPLLAFALLIPVGVLFGQAWQGQSDRLSFAAKERHGIEYLTTLGQVTTAVTDAQSAAVAGRPADRAAVTRAVDAATEVDDRLGEELRTSERWSGLRVKIEALSSVPGGDRARIYDAYGEVTDLLLALYGKVRENSQLIRDPEADTYFLQDGAAEELPESVVAAGRFADLVVIAAGRPAAERTAAIADLVSARGAVLDPAADLADGLQSAVDSTESRTLGGNLLSRLDRFRRSMDGLASSAGTLDGRSPLPTADRLNPARIEVQAAASELSNSILAELDVLIADRRSSIRTERAVSLVAFAVAVLGCAVPSVLALRKRRRRRRPFGGPHRTVLPRAAGPEQNQSQWEPVGAAR
ncbi:hypothetical protein RB614_22130 [Phytohabitans sp. ZYX-F-186]|uniref:Nitrate/nitrite sensing protein domain-containing protein n=1 Tax=Phytohabitans maris TaxID=3071409 RepID=A0ABU0ZJI6_9ACTN|nr:hypothetical protein [Phytohabitans sp. ZYX-F-186]MDQ7907216.1 hypothetical protein [Phytohabitans sp. ZYX-F-186]